MLRVPDTAFRWVVNGTVALLVFVPFARHLFHFELVHASDLLLSRPASSPFCRSRA